MSRAQEVQDRFVASVAPHDRERAVKAVKGTFEYQCALFQDLVIELWGEIKRAFRSPS